VLLRDVQLRDYRLHLADRVPEQNVALELGPLDLDLQDFDSLGTSPFSLKLDTGVGKQGSLQAEGRVQLKPTTASLKVTSHAIDLRLAQAYLSPLLRLELRSGLLDSALDVALDATQPLAFSVTGKARINQLHTLDTLKERDFVRWQQLDLLGLDYRHNERLSIDKVQLNQPYARFIINEDLTTNVSDLLIARSGDPAPGASAQSAEPAASPPLGIHIGEISIDDGSANFADFSLTPNFATAIQQLNGRIGSLDNRSQKPASVDIAGKVDRYAPVSIKGSLNPFDPLDSLDIHTQFKQLELTTLTPYSGKFAGYRIRKGRLNLDLHYRISQGKLNAENSVVVEQLQLGEKVDSPSAVDLPIRLAVALLKDTEGKIALSLPVQGDFNNPEFSLMPVVWKTLRNLILRAAQAPFKFIGGLVSGGAQMDLSTVRFDPGSSELDSGAQAALDLLASALKERPALRLEVEGISAPSSDGPPLAEQRLQREYQNTYHKILQRRGDAVPAAASQLEVPLDEQGPLLEGIYRARLKQQPPAEWQELDEEQRTANLRDAIVRYWGKSQLLQRRLAQARASSIKDYLVEHGGLADERVYLLDVGLGQAQADGRVATALHLDSQ
jgi:outer membrane protein OmpA-like peptidoglycan-associated protein